MNCTRRSLCFALGFGLGAASGAMVRAAEPAGADLLRPPGASADFLAACVRCARCVEACPSDVLSPAGLDAGLAASTPHFVARDNPCDLCAGEETMHCIEACPSGALQSLDSIEAVRIGTAEIRTDICYAYNGVTCRACWHACPLPNDAIYFEPATLRPVVDAEQCVGCGLCEHACLTEEPSIVVRPIGVAS